MIQRGNGRSRTTPAGVSRLPPELPPSAHTRTSLRSRAETMVAEHPVACIAAALMLGATLGWLIKRR